jgi:hypothetical protein
MVLLTIPTLVIVVLLWTMSISGCGLWLVKSSQELPHNNNTSAWDSFVLTRRAVLTLDYKATN